MVIAARQGDWYQWYAQKRRCWDDWQCTENEILLAESRSERAVSPGGPLTHWPELRMRTQPLYNCKESACIIPRVQYTTSSFNISARTRMQASNHATDQDWRTTDETTESIGHCSTALPNNGKNCHQFFRDYYYNCILCYYTDNENKQPYIRRGVPLA